MTGTEEKTAPRAGARRSSFCSIASRLMADVMIAAVIAAIFFAVLALPILSGINAQGYKETDHDETYYRHDDLRND